MPARSSRRPPWPAQRACPSRSNGAPFPGLEPPSLPQTLMTSAGCHFQDDARKKESETPLFAGSAANEAASCHNTAVPLSEPELPSVE